MMELVAAPACCRCRGRRSALLPAAAAGAWDAQRPDAAAGGGVHADGGPRDAGKQRSTGEAQGEEGATQRGGKHAPKKDKDFWPPSSYWPAACSRHRTHTSPLVNTSHKEINLGQVEQVRATPKAVGACAAALLIVSLSASLCHFDRCRGADCSLGLLPARCCRAWRCRAACWMAGSRRCLFTRACWAMEACRWRFRSWTGSRWGLAAAEERLGGRLWVGGAAGVEAVGMGVDQTKDAGSNCAVQAPACTATLLACRAAPGWLLRLPAPASAVGGAGDSLLLFPCIATSALQLPLLRLCSCARCSRCTPCPTRSPSHHFTPRNLPSLGARQGGGCRRRWRRS